MIVTLIHPLPKPVELPVNDQIALEGSKGAKILGIAVIVLTGLLYYIFW